MHKAGSDEIFQKKEQLHICTMKEFYLPNLIETRLLGFAERQTWNTIHAIGF